MVVTLLLTALLSQASPPPLVAADGPTTPLPAPARPPPAAAPDAGVRDPSAPPIFSSDVPLEAPPEVAPPPRTSAPHADHPTAVLHFSPVSLFATHLCFELEKAISQSLSVFGAVGASLIAQVGFDFGLRVYVGERVLDGPFLAAQGSVFYFSSAQVLLVGPGAMFGYVFRPRGSLALSIGAGVQLWHQPIADSNVRVLGVLPGADVIFLPGFQRPGVGGWAPQPMVRITVGPTF